MLIKGQGLLHLRNEKSVLRRRACRSGKKAWRYYRGLPSQRLVKGKSEAEAKHLYDEFMSMVSGGEYDEELLDEAAAFKGVAQLPARIKCATLCWKGMHRLLDELDKDEGENSGK